MLETYWYVPKVKRFVRYKYVVHVNEKLVNSSDLNLIEYKEVSTDSTHGKGQIQLPPNAESEYLQTRSVGFSFDKSFTPTEIKYNITLRTRQSLPEGAIAVLTFENPDPQAAPVEIVYEPKPEEKEIFVRSPTCACVVNGGQYKIVVTLFTDRERRNILGKHEQLVAFSAPAEILEVARVPDCRSTGKVSSGDQSK